MIILFGFKGCGKTFWAKKLSSSLKKEFIDIDDLIIESFKKKEGRVFPISVIYQMLGDEGFRQIESEVVFGLKEDSSQVISLGGGTLLKKENLAYIKQMGTLVYLKCSLEKIKKRLGRSHPFFDLEKVFEERSKIFGSIPAHVIDLDLISEEEVLQQLKEIADGI